DIGLFVRDQQHHIDGAPDLLRIASHLGTVLFQDGALSLEHSGPTPNVPVVGMLCRYTECDALASSADHQFRIRFLHGFGIERSVEHGSISPVKITAMLRPERPDHLARLIQPLEPLAPGVEGNSVGLVLVLLPTGAESKQEPSTRNDIDLRGHLRHYCRMSIGIAENNRADSYSRDESCERG